MTRRRQWLGVLAAAAVAALLAAWIRERDARSEAEAEVRRLRAERRRRPAPDRPGPRPEIAPEFLPVDGEPSGPGSEPPRVPGPDPAGPEAAPPADPPAPFRPSSFDPAAAGPLREMAELVDARDPLGTLDRLLAFWERVTPGLPREQFHALWQEMHRAMQQVAKVDPALTAPWLVRQLALTPPATNLQTLLFDCLRDADPAQAADYVRAALESSNPEFRRDAIRLIVALPEEERMGTWSGLLRHPDPGMRESALQYLPGDGPEWAKVLDEAAAVETDAGRRGEMLAMAFEANPASDRLDPLLRELEYGRDPRFRAAVITGLQEHLTMRDRSAIALLERIALDRDEDGEVREQAFAALLDGDELLPREERERIEQVRAALWQERDGDE